MSRVFVLVFSVFFLFVRSEAEADTENKKSQTRLMLTLFYRHSRLHRLNRRFNRSIPNLFRQVPRALRAAGLPDIKSFDVEPKPVHGFTYADTKALAFDESVVESSRARLFKSAHDVIVEIQNKAQKFPLNSLQQDLIDYSRFGTLKSYLYLVPLLYDQSGHALLTDLSDSEDRALLLEKIQFLTGEQLYFNYERMINLALSQAEGSSHDFIRSIKNQFVDKELRSKLLSGNKATVLRFSLEEVDPLVALIRGAIGLDCTLKSVAFHALVRGVKVYWFRTSHRMNESIAGYIFVVPVKFGEHIIPHVVTINGPGVRPQHVEPLISAIGSLWNSASVALPEEVELYDGIVNQASIAEAMFHASDLPVNVRAINDDWEKIDSFLEKNEDAARAENYYEIGWHRTHSVRLHRIGISVEHKELGMSVAYQPPDFLSLPLSQRILLAGRFGKYSRMESAEVREATRVLGLSEEQFKLAKALELATEQKHLAAETLLKVERMGLTPTDLLQWPLKMVAKSLRVAFKQNSRAFGDPKWTQLENEIASRLDEKTIAADKNRNPISNDVLSILQDQPEDCETMLEEEAY